MKKFFIIFFFSFFLWFSHPVYSLAFTATSGSLSPSDAKYYIFFSDSNKSGSMYFSDVRRIALAPPSNTSDFYWIIFQTYSSDSFFCNVINDYDDINLLDTYWGSENYFVTGYLNNGHYSRSSVTTNVPIFSTPQEAMNYIVTGDDTGNLNVPPAPEFDSIAYDFTQDLYNPEYPLPELSDLSYDSFYIHNSKGYSFDLVVQTTFYGTKMQKFSEGGNHYITDKLRKFRQHEYNFTLADPLSTSGLVSIKDTYSIDLLETFKSDWIDWSNLYPTLDTLPGYSWFNSIGYTSRFYLDYRVFNEDRVSERGLLTSLDLTGCCETKFFVRYRDDSGYGQWMVYTVSGTDSDGVSAEVGEAGKPAFITTGAVSGSTASGVPIITDPVTQRYDPINEQYDVVLNDGSDINWNLSVDNFENAFSFFGEMPNLVATVFSCYPAWMVQLIGSTITFLCALAIYHGIRG